MTDVSPTLVLATLAALVFFGMIFEEVFRRTGVPDVLILLVIGFAGSVSGVLDLSSLGMVGKVFSTAALVLILFEGALRMRLADLRASLGGAMLLSVAGFVVTAGIVTVAGVTLFGLSLLAAAMLGCILGGTSSAVVIPMVQNLRIQQETRTILTLESALTDVMCIVFTLALVSAAVAGGVQWSVVARDLAYGFGIALMLGGLLGYGFARSLAKLRAKRPSMLFLGAAVFIVYAAAEAIGTFGAIACLAFGVVLGNVRQPDAGDTDAVSPAERFFLSEMAFLLKIFFFVYLGASLRLSGYEPIVFGGLTTVLVYLVRPLAVRLSLRAKVTPKQDAAIASVMAPKGLAAAVLASIPAQRGVAEGAVIESITFGVILFSVTLTSVLALGARTALVRDAYGRIFRRYLEPPAAPEAPAAAPADPSAPPAAAPTTAAPERAAGATPPAISG